MVLPVACQSGVSVPCSSVLCSVHNVRSDLLAPPLPPLKKLKLLGRPFKIYKNGTFIWGVFNSELEVATFA